MRALVIDDSRAMRRIVGSTLRGLGFEPVEAEHGRHALDLLADGPLPELEVGEQVVAILGKRRTDLTGDDIDTMQQVVDQVRTIRGDEPEPEAYDDDVRRMLMSFGHDPLKPPEA